MALLQTSPPRLCATKMRLRDDASCSARSEVRSLTRFVPWSSIDSTMRPLYAPGKHHSPRSEFVHVLDDEAAAAGAMTLVDS